MIPETSPLDSYQRQAILLVLIRAMHDVSGWCGTEHMDKAIQFLQEVAGVPLQYNINYAGYSPVAFDADIDLGALYGNYLITFGYKDPFGMDHRLTDNATRFLTRYAEVVARYEAKIRFVVERVAKWTFPELERNSTALWVCIIKPHAARPELIADAQRLNPRLEQHEIIAGLDAVDRFRRDLDARFPCEAPRVAAG